ncbi:hypothetical protein E6C76_01595 [Pseudothauera nasutitermitis]|uniref:Uncharacterized protein n=1 Tax=Pseudothauera nasutitermitis TaxID=2565930 RepID=A0A4S4B367_9RHOO|nr:hypothetical protein [Pseudothauera nasutitermitis]THF67107.1 hypothetical protein E6C76_01595 [Pseudothauera nasutitermitis]
MGLFSRFSTRQLTATRFHLTSDRRVRNAIVVLLVIGVLGAIGAATVHYFEARLAPAIRVAELEEENRQLRAEADSVRMELEMERATRAELKRQVTQLNEQVSQLNHQLGFFNSQANGARKPN